MAREIHVTIESMAFKGYGVTRINGKVVFIPYALKGEEALVEIVEEKKDYSIARLNRIISPSQWRVSPPCPYFGRCGGCQWQHIEYDHQGEVKKEILVETLKRLGGLREIPPVHLVPSPQAYGYRVRAQLKVQDGRVGYYQEKSHRIVQIDHCPIAHPLVNQIIPMICQGEMFPLLSHIGEFEINVSPEDGQGVFILHPFSSLRGMERIFRGFLQRHKILKGIAVKRKEDLSLFGQTDLHFTLSFNWNGQITSLRLRTSPGCFFQINLSQNQQLIQTVIQFGDVKPGERVLDLYAGVGNFTLPLALNADEVVGIEENATAVEDAHRNALENGIERCRFIHGRVEDVLRRSPIERFDLVVLDPPRTGCKRVVPQIVDVGPKRIVYVSCDPATFSRDLRLLVERGYTLQRLALVDLFPQTYHMEVVGLLLAGR